MILADIGNTNAHICEDFKIEHMSIALFLDRYPQKRLYYISVNKTLTQESLPDSWRDISGMIHIPGEYDGMGVDRRALCLSHQDGVFVDAGSAITVDRVVGGIYQGGFILPGITAYQKAYASISDVLDCRIDKDIDIDKIPISTASGISFATIASIVTLIREFSKGMDIYITGGDGRVISQKIDRAIYDESLLFKGIKKAIKNKEL